MDTALRQLLQLAFQAHQQGRWDEVSQHCTEVFQSLPEQPDALFLMAEACRGQGRPGDAAVLYDRSLRGKSNQAHVWIRLADLQDSLGQWNDAVASYARALILQPGLVAAQYNQARLLRQLGRPAEAAAAVAQALAVPGGTSTLRAQLLQLQALLLEDTGDLTSALNTLDLALAETPDRAALHHNRGVVLQRLAQSQEALAAHDRALALGLDIPDLHYNRGNSLQSLGRLNQALLAYRTALGQDTQHALSLFDCARLRWRLGHDDFAAELDAATQAAPQSAVAPGIKGRLLLRAGRFEESAVAFKTATKLAPQTAGYFDGLGQACSRLGHHQLALAAHQRAVELSPQEAATHISHAGALLQAGRPEHAVQVAQTALALDRLDQQAWAFQGLAWRAMGDAREGWLNDLPRQLQVFDLPAPPGWPNMDAFNRALAQLLDEMHRDTQAPIDQTLRYGTQTLGNVFENPHPLLAQLKVLLAQAVDHYVAGLRRLAPDHLHPLLGRLAPAWRFSDSWSSNLRSGGFHTNHVHAHGWISSCYYVAVPQSVGGSAGAADSQAGWITFGAADIDVPGCALAEQFSVQPKVGRLVLFPSYMWHGTRPFTDDQSRLTVAFDVLPQG